MKKSFFDPKLIIFLCYLIALIRAVPLTKLDETLCSQTKNRPGENFLYNYETTTDLSLNDDKKSTVALKTMINLKRIKDCSFLMTLSNTTVTSDDGVFDMDEIKKLNDFGALFTFGSDVVKFLPNDESWSKNIKRGIISLIFKRTSETTQFDDKEAAANVQQSLQFVRKSKSKIENGNIFFLFNT